MTGKGRQTAREPATKFAHLRKKMEKNKLAKANNADLVIPGFQHLVKWLDARLAGCLFVGGCTKPEAIGEDVKTRAVDFAHGLAMKVS